VSKDFGGKPLKSLYMSKTKAEESDGKPPTRQSLRKWLNSQKLKDTEDTAEATSEEKEEEQEKDEKADHFPYPQRLIEEGDISVVDSLNAKDAHGSLCGHVPTLIAQSETSIDIRFVCGINEHDFCLPGGIPFVGVQSCGLQVRNGPIPFYDPRPADDLRNLGCFNIAEVLQVGKLMRVCTKRIGL
jgi:hypothetical protein